MQYGERPPERRNGGAMARLTTHILDTAHGLPGAGVAVRLFALGAERELLLAVHTNADGRTDAPLLESDALKTGAYELEFDIGAYFEGRGVYAGDPPFLGTVVIRVNLASGEDYHVPLLATPWSYSTYRGS